MVEIREVKTRKQIKEFIDFPLNLYKDSPYYVPEFRSDQRQLFGKKCIYLDQVEQVFYLAYKDNKVVGRVQGIIQKLANEKWNQKRVRFTRFDTIDDQEVATALLQAVETWAKEKGMKEIVGPLGYNDFEREGLLIEGFDQTQTFEEQYNYDYYQKLIESQGFEKEVDWVESKIYAPEDKKKAEVMLKLSDRIMRTYKLEYLNAKNTNELLNKHGEEFFDIVDDTYKDIYGTVPFTDSLKKKTIDSFRLILDLKYCALIKDETGKVVCFGLCFPSIAEAVRKCKGRYTPIGIIRLLHAIKHPKIIDFGLIGVREEYLKKGVNGIILAECIKILTKGDIEYAETNLNLEDNAAVRSQWKYFKEVQNKRRRSYKKEIK